MRSRRIKKSVIRESDQVLDAFLLEYFNNNVGVAHILSSLNKWLS